MQLTISQLKQNAKARLKGNWGGAIGAIFIPSMIAGVISSFVQGIFSTIFSISTVGFVNSMDSYALYDDPAYWEQMLPLLVKMIPSMILLFVVSALTSILIAYPLSCGSEYWFYRLARGYKPSLGDVFYFLSSGKRYKKILIFSLNMNLRIFAWSMLFISVPTLIITFGSVTETYSLAIVGMVLLYVMIFALIPLTLRYSLAFTQLCDGMETDSSTSEPIKRSFIATKGKKGSIFGMGLSFFGWFFVPYFALIVVVVMGAAMESVALMGISFLLIFVWLVLILFYLAPYMQAAFAEQYRNYSDLAFGPPPSDPALGGFPPTNGYPFNPQFSNPSPQNPNQPVQYMNTPQAFEPVAPPLYVAPQAQDFNAPQPSAPQPPTMQSYQPTGQPPNAPAYEPSAPQPPVDYDFSSPDATADKNKFENVARDLGDEGFGIRQVSEQKEEYKGPEIE